MTSTPRSAAGAAERSLRSSDRTQARPVLLPDLAGLLDALHRPGRRIIGPTVAGGAIVLRELAAPADLPYGWTADVEGGAYRLRPGPATRAFANAVGPQSWKQFLQ